MLTGVVFSFLSSGHGDHKNQDPPLAVAPLTADTEVAVPPVPARAGPAEVCPVISCEAPVPLLEEEEGAGAGAPELLLVYVPAAQQPQRLH